MRARPPETLHLCPPVPSLAATLPGSPPSTQFWRALLPPRPFVPRPMHVVAPAVAGPRLRPRLAALQPLRAGPGRGCQAQGSGGTRDRGKHSVTQPEGRRLAGERKPKASGWLGESGGLTTLVRCSRRALCACAAVCCCTCMRLRTDAGTRNRLLAGEFAGCRRPPPASPERLPSSGEARAFQAPRQAQHSPTTDPRRCCK